MRRPARCVLPVILGLLGPSSAAPVCAQGAVLVVDWLGGPGSQYLSIPDAVAAASDGDVILVRPGFYQPFAIDGKSLVVEGDAPAGAGPALGVGASSPAIMNLAAGQSVVLRNFRMTPFLGVAAQIDVRDCAGAVLLEDLQLSGGAPCLRVQHCAAVVAARCTLAGGDALAGSSFPSGGAALEALDASVYLYDCTASGGSGYDAFFPNPPVPGFDAVRVEGGLFLASGAVLRGGDGGDGGSAFFGGCFPGASGGDALELVAGAPAAYALDSAFTGGLGGAGYSQCMPGGGGSPVHALSGALTALPGVRGSLHSSSPLREGEASQLELWGPGGNLALLLLSPASQALLALPYSGVALPSLGTGALLSLGFTNPAGYLLVPFAVGPLPLGVQESGLFLQAVFANTASGQVLLGAPSHLLQLDQSL